MIKSIHGSDEYFNHINDEIQCSASKFSILSGMADQRYLMGNTVEQPTFGHLSQFSSSCLNFRLDVSFFVQLSHYSSRCLIFRPVVSIFV
ncbi:hypothetical protein V9T40_008539 [Parthenolecanium corni]|uniref:Uncharacterized protein n=1 Tax=Parthenolecanium corni TaxID=536013 RepID=A0AAN9Y610_9HEMI